MCGRAKSAEPAPAVELYKGGLFRSSVKWARTVTDDAHIFILSALHGIVPGAQVLEPYNVRLGDPGSVTATRVAHQARQLGLIHTPVVFVGGDDYATLVCQVWGEGRVRVPFGKRAGHKQWFQMMDAMRASAGRLP